jgi:hypothetical protein
MLEKLYTPVSTKCPSLDNLKRGIIFLAKKP